jgi:hypothetical protein
MKKHAFYFLTFISFVSFGQGKMDLSKFQIGLSVSPDYSFTTNHNYYEIPKVGLTAGLNAVYQFNKRVGLETGLHYSNKGFQTKMIDLFYFEPEPTSPNQAKFIYNYDFIDIPLKANFSIGNKKTRFFTSVGVTMNIFLKETQTNIYAYGDRTEKETINPTDNSIRKVNLSPSLSFGIDYTFNDNSYIRIDPTFRCAMFKLVDGGAPGNLISTGLNFSYFFRK